MLGGVKDAELELLLVAGNLLARAESHREECGAWAVTAVMLSSEQGEPN